MKKYPAWVMGGLLVMLAGRAARADALDMFGASSRATAMGGAMTAISVGAEGAVYNASSLALSPNSASMEWTSFRSHLNINGTNFGPGDSDFGPMPNLIGLNQRFLRDRIGVGLILVPSGFGGPGGKGSGGGEGIGLITNGYGWPMYGTSTIPLYYGIGFRLHDKLAVGFTQATNITLVRFSDITLNIDDLLESVIGVSTGIPPVGINPNVNISAATEPGKVGVSVTFKPVKYLSLGYAQRPGSWMRLKIPIFLTSTGLMSDDIRILVISDIANTPDKEQLGAAVHVPLPHSTLTLAWSQDHQFWGRLRKDRLKETVRWTEPNIASLIQVSYGPPGPMTDVSVDHYGLEYLMDAPWLPGKFLKQRNPQVAVRGGYYHWNSPLPNKLYGTDFDSDANIYSLGLGLSLDRRSQKYLKDPTVARRFSLDLHAQYFDLEDRNYKLTYDYWGNHRGSSSVYYYHTEGKITNLGLQATWWH